MARNSVLRGWGHRLPGGRRFSILMIPAVRFVTVTFACTAAWLGTSVSHAQNPAACSAVRFSEELLQEFPRAPEACLDVISRGGEEIAVFNVRLNQVRGNTVRVRFHHPDGSLGPSTRITLPNDFRVLVDGEPTPVRDLAVNQDLKAYVPVSRPMVALEPAEPAQALHLVPLVDSAQAQGDAASDERTRLAEADRGSLSSTAGPLPLVALGGLAFLLTALCLRAMRLRGK